jgi:hypothetical protein
MIPQHTIKHIRTRNALARHQRVRERFQELYNIKRIRYDDVIERLCAEFFYQESTVKRILSS